MHSVWFRVLERLGRDKEFVGKHGHGLVYLGEIWRIIVCRYVWQFNKIKLRRVKRMFAVSHRIYFLQ